MNKLAQTVAIVCTASLIGGPLVLQGATDKVTIKVETNKKIAGIQPNMYGIFFEDINFGADGGLYAELIKNRSFEFPQHLLGWKTFGNTEILNDGPFPRNPHYIRLSNPGHPHKHTGLENEGFRGIGIKSGEKYRFSVWARSKDGKEQSIRVELVNSQNNPVTKSNLNINSGEWKKYEMILEPNRTDSHALLRIFLTSQGAVDLEHISLFPVNTWKGHENGMRHDLAQALADLHPGVFRFPGGCIVEGTEIPDRYQWKNTVGPVENRPLNKNRWEYTFPHRFFPDYFQSYGLGFYEFFLLSEEIGADPLPVLNCGLVCQYQNNSKNAHIALADLDPYIQDALDLIEFANGDTTTQWGKLRAQMGHPTPFGLKMMGIGNEQWGPEYPERLQLFVKALRSKHPEILIIGSSGPSAEGDKFDYLWPEMKKLKVDLVDEHYYKSPEWFLSNAGRYDAYDRKGPKVFAGEYASHHKSRDNNFISALSEAAFMTGLERNADVVHLATYAPLFAHVDGWQWKPDLIWFDNLGHVLTPNYYVQQLFAQNKGTHALRTTSAESDLKGQRNIYATSAIDKEKSQLIIKIVNTNDQPQNISIDLYKNKYKLADQGQVTILQADQLEKTNSLKNPQNIVPTTTTLPVKGNNIELNTGKYSFYVIVIPFVQ